MEAFDKLYILKNFENVKYLFYMFNVIDFISIFNTMYLYLLFNKK